MGGQTRSPHPIPCVRGSYRRVDRAVAVSVCRRWGRVRRVDGRGHRCRCSCGRGRGRGRRCGCGRVRRVSAALSIALIASLPCPLPSPSTSLRRVCRPHATVAVVVYAALAVSVAVAVAGEFSPVELPNKPAKPSPWRFVPEGHEGSRRYTQCFETIDDEGGSEWETGSLRVVPTPDARTPQKSEIFRGPCATLNTNDIKMVCSERSSGTRKSSLITTYQDVHVLRQQVFNVGRI
jgi:hypothetical protein